MPANNLPTVFDSDDFIRAWAVQRGKHGGLKAFIYLHDPTECEHHKMAVIHYDRPGYPVERVFKIPKGRL
nr:hypothetical protein [uncultured Pseudogulbenkiania sp.]